MKENILNNLFVFLYGIAIVCIGIFVYLYNTKTLQDLSALRKEYKEYIEKTEEKLSKSSLEASILEDNLNSCIKLSEKLGSIKKCEKQAYLDYRINYNNTCYATGLPDDCFLPEQTGSRLYSGYQKNLLICSQKFSN